MKTRSATCVLNAKAYLGEGPVWHPESHSLIWVDIDDGEIHQFDPATGADSVTCVGQPVGAVSLRSRGGFILALRDGIALYDPLTEDLQFVATIEPKTADMRFNDGKCDPAGRFWAGTLGFDESGKGLGCLYRLDPDRSFHAMVPNVAVSNGLAWSQDHRTMYFIDSLSRSVDAFDFDVDTGAITNRRVISPVEEEMGFPDGMCIDCEGKLWVAHCQGGCVARIDPEMGKRLETIKLPVSRVTSCAFGDSDLKTLYITSGRFGLDEAALDAEPLAGGLFAVELPVAGMPVSTFSG